MCKKFTPDELNKMDHKTKDGVIYQMQDRLDQLERNYENLMEQVRLANQQRFGRHTEKLEDICDHVGLLHKGGILLSKDLEDMKFHIHKIQCVLSGRQQEKELEKELQVLKVQHQGSLLMITARGTRSEIMEKIQAKNPLFMEVLPLTLEEIFISETEVAGYEIKNLF